MSRLFKKPRPTSLTVVAWVLIMMNLAAFARVLLMTMDPITLLAISGSSYYFSMRMAIAVEALSSISNIAIAIAIFMGHAWARIAYVAVFIVAIIAQLANLPVDMYRMLITGTLIFILFTWLLFRACATEYFRAAND